MPLKCHDVIAQLIGSYCKCQKNWRCLKLSHSSAFTSQPFFFQERGDFLFVFLRTKKVNKSLKIKIFQELLQLQQLMPRVELRYYVYATEEVYCCTVIQICRGAPQNVLFSSSPIFFLRGNVVLVAATY